jgi:Rieske Fe-S protein
MDLENKINRRAVLCGALATAVLGFIPEVADAATGITQQKNGKFQIDLSKNPTLNKVGGALQIPLSDGSTAALVRVAKGATAKAFTAIYLTCTHQGATVQEVGNMWLCPLHGSEYTLAGKVIKGPAQSNLQKIPFTVSKNMVLLG